jgi:uncharacterized damage-inducible protein DinB
MTVDEIRTLYAFNRWAHDRVLAACDDLSADEFTRDLRTSHGSIRGTLVHTLWSEWVWLRRWLGESPKIVFSEADYPDLGVIKPRWHALDRERWEFIDTLTNQRLERVFGYENRKGEHWEYSYLHAMQHVANHASYHRGQIVTMLRQLGRTPPATDYLLFFDEGAPAPVKE